MRVIVIILSLILGCANESHEEFSPLMVPDGSVAVSDVNLPDIGDSDADINQDSGVEIPIIDLTEAFVSSCRVPVEYDGNRPIFTDTSEAWGLNLIEPKGTRLSAGDINGDGLPDLAVRRAGTRVDILDESDPNYARFHWLLLNKRGTFEDVTLSSGFSKVRQNYDLNVGRPAEVIAFADVDNDGDLDIYTGVDARQALSVEAQDGSMVSINERTELLLNDGSGHFELAAADNGIRRADRQDVPSGISFIDADLDGNLDAWITQGGLGAPMQDKLLMGQGLGEFSDETRTVSLRSENWVELEAMNEGRAHTTAWSAAACDLNGDGLPELLAGSYGRAPNHLWRAQLEQDVLSYENESVASGFAFDGDETWQDNQFAACFCQSNTTAEGCDRVSAPRISCTQENWRHDTDRNPFRLGGNTGAVICADFDNDGWQDLVTTEIKHWWAGAGSDGSELLHNQHANSVRFIRPGNESTGLVIPHVGTSWDEGIITGTWLDFDNDGRKDLYLGGTDYNNNRGYLFHNRSTPGEPKFQLIDPNMGIDQHRSHGVVAGDFDGDGDVDLVVGHSKSRCDQNDETNCYPTRKIRFFENTLADGGNWLQLDLVGGPNTNRDAIGARVVVKTSSQEQSFEINGGYGHYGSQNDHILHIGLGGECEAEVYIHWPNRARNITRYRFPSNTRFKVIENQRPVPVTFAP